MVLADFSIPEVVKISYLNTLSLLLKYSFHIGLILNIYGGLSTGILDR